MEMPLEGIRVIERAGGIAGPTAGLMLGNLGAEVIRVEEPLGGNRSGKGTTGERLRRAMPKEALVQFLAQNRNKKSLTVDLLQEAGKEILRRVIEKSDVFITSLRDREAARLGIDYAQLSEHNPRLVYARISGLGPKGPDSERRVWDSICQARSGLMTCLGEADGPPSLMVGSVSDVTEGTMCAFGVVTALLARDRLGVGQEVDTSMLHSAIWVQMSGLAGSLFRGKVMPRFSRTRASTPLRCYYKCGDGEWLMIWESGALAEPERYWHELCRVLGLDHLEKDPRFEDSQARRQHREEMIGALDAVFASRSRAEWLDILDREHADFGFSPLQNALDLPDDPQVRENEYLVDVDDRLLGPVKLAAFPIKLSRTPAIEGDSCPELGEHTEQVLTEVVGYTREEVASFRGKGLI